MLKILMKLAYIVENNGTETLITDEAVDQTLDTDHTTTTPIAWDTIDTNTSKAVNINSSLSNTPLFSTRYVLYK